MNELINKNVKNVLTLDSREVAGMVEKDHRNLLRDIRGYMEELGELKIEQSDFFIPSTFRNVQNKELPQYLITKKGCEFISHKLTGIKGTAFTATYINRFHELEKVVTKPLSTHEIMRIQLGMIDDHEERIDKLENRMTIDYGQQQVLKKKVNARVVYLLGGKGSSAYREVSKKVFSECNRDIQDYFNVNSRNNIPKLKFNDAIEYIQEWEPSTNTKMMIKDCNAQTVFS